MRSRRRIIRRLRAAALGLAACAALAAPAAAEPGAYYPQPSTAKIGDTPADYAGMPGAPVARAPKIGDTPADYPGASRAPDYQAPTTIEVVRPEPTIVRDADATLPVMLAGLALLIALASAGYSIARARALKRRVAH
jgi:hypothetical protein